MKVFVACSGVDNVSLKYRNIASDVATSLVRHNHKLVYGGGYTGMMGKCYMTFRYESGKIKAILDVHDSECLDSIEVDAYEVMPSTFDKSKMIYQSSDMFLILPGGMEVASLFFSLLEEKRARSEDKPIILFNYDGFFNPILKFLESAHKDEFVSIEDIKLFSIVNDIKSLERFLNAAYEEEER